MRARLVCELAADGVPVAVACRVLRLSRAAYYDHLTRPPSAREQADAVLSVTIAEVHARSRGTYGAPRVHADLRLGLGVRCGRKRVARLMAAAGLVGVSHQRKRAGTGPLPATHTDLVQRRFTADGPDRLWCTDITEHPTGQGKVYCAAVSDVWSRRIVGWSIADHIRAELVVDALQMAQWQRRPAAGTVVHSDRGSQYTSWVFGHRLRGGRPARVDGPGRLERRQRPHGVVLVHDATRTPRPPDLEHPGRARLGDLRMDRRLLQPRPPALRSRLPVPGRLREAHPSRPHPSGLTTHPNRPGNRVKLPCTLSAGRCSR